MSHHTGQTSGHRLVGYFPGWGPAQNYQVTDIPLGKLTHVIYAFAQVNRSADCVTISKTDGVRNFLLLRDLKVRQPGLRTLISIGGASHSTYFPNAAMTDPLRRHCAQSCVAFMKTNGFDGIDIDWEFPDNDLDSYIALLQALRDALDADGQGHLLTAAVPAGSHRHPEYLARILSTFDWLNLMTYDYTIKDSTKTDFVAPLEAYDHAITAHSKNNVDASVQAYIAAGVRADKLVLGTRFVGTGWQGVAAGNDGLYQRNGGPAKGTWDRDGKPTGAFGYQDITTNYIGKFGTRAVHQHADAKVPWFYSPDAGVMISYEDPQSLKAKADYLRAKALGGAMIWELAADDAQHTLLDTLAGALR